MNPRPEPPIEAPGASADAPSPDAGDAAPDGHLVTLRRLLAEVQALSARIAAVNEIGTAMSRSLRLDEILRVVGRQAKWLLDFEHASCALLRDGAWESTVSLFGPPVPVSQADLDASTHLATAVRSAQPQLVRDGQLGVSSTPYRSWLLLPLLSEGEPLGTIHFATSRPSAYTIEDVRIAYLLALQLSAALRNALRFEEQKRLHAVVEAEKQRSDSLLENILPKRIADELKRTGRVQPVHYPSASVLFTDFADFTHHTASLTPGDLVSTLDRCFRSFDAIAERHGLEKLKTVGDSFMCAGGVPATSATHAVDCVRAALAMRDLVVSEGPRTSSGAAWRIRIGVHSGPLVAGVIGQRKFTYDIWGDTVNVASRLEKHALPDTVNISEATRALLDASFTSAPRGAIEVKGKGPVAMFIVDRAPHASAAHMRSPLSR